MKIFLKNLFISLVFVFCLMTKVLAGDLGVTSVVYDNSASMLTINTMDSNDYEFREAPKLHIVKDENKAYFDINYAVLKCKSQNLVINSSDISEIKVGQFSLNPNIVRVVISYDSSYNPANIQLKKINSTLFINFKNTTISNFYFQHVYGDAKGADFYESTVIQYPSSTYNVNNATKVASSADDKSTLEKVNLALVTKYYADNVKISSSMAILNGFGNIHISNPLYLTNPTRIAYDISNAYVNPDIRNKEYSLTSTEKIKIGQFTKNTARVVITGNNSQSYIPVVNSDNQRITFINKNNYKASLLYGIKTDLSTINYGKANSELKFSFTKPVVYGIEKTPSSLDLILYNVDKYNDASIKSTVNNTEFSTIKSAKNNQGGLVLSVPINTQKETDIHVGVDGKTIRIKNKNIVANAQTKKNTTPSTTNTKTTTIPKENLTPVTENPIKSIIAKATTAKVKGHVVIDPGHGGTDCGATRNGIYEKDIVLDVSKRVEKLLKDMGYTVDMTRTTDIYVSLQDRVEFSENLSPDIFVSVHVNSSNSDSPYGIETHYYKENSLQLAKTVHASMLNNISSKDRGLFQSKFYVINHTTAPAILVEMGFISNAQERAQLVTEARKKATAKAIAEGIDEYLKKYK